MSAKFSENDITANKFAIKYDPPVIALEYHLIPLNANYLLQIDLENSIKQYDDPNDICNWIFETYGDIVTKKVISEKQVLNLVQRILLMRRMKESKKSVPQTQTLKTGEELFEPDPLRKEEEKEFYKSGQDFYKQDEDETGDNENENKEEVSEGESDIKLDSNLMNLNSNLNANANANANSNANANANSNSNASASDEKSDINSGNKNTANISNPHEEISFKPMKNKNNSGITNSALDARNRNYSDDDIQKELEDMNKMHSKLVEEAENSNRGINSNENLNENDSDMKAIQSNQSNQSNQNNQNNKGNEPKLNTGIINDSSTNNEINSARIDEGQYNLSNNLANYFSNPNEQKNKQNEIDNNFNYMDEISVESLNSDNEEKI